MRDECCIWWCSPSYYQVKFWSKQFKWSMESIEENSRSGRPVEESWKEKCRKVEDVILQDSRVKVSIIAHELGISAGTVSGVIHSFLMMSKVSSLWMSWMFTPEQKACHQHFSEENLDILRGSPEKFFCRIITGDETWVHLHNPETEQESMQWKHKGYPTTKIFMCNNQPERSWQ